MRLLLDTHALLWFYLSNEKLSQMAKAAILDPSSEVFVSPASYWEIAIKISLGKYQLNENYSDFIDNAIVKNGFKILAIETSHTAKLLELSFHHKDPFDRLLVAQALVEQLTLVSNEKIFDDYNVPRIW